MLRDDLLNYREKQIGADTENLVTGVKHLTPASSIACSRPKSASHSSLESPQLLTASPTEMSPFSFPHHRPGKQADVSVSWATVNPRVRTAVCCSLFGSLMDLDVL